MTPQPRYHIWFHITGWTLLLTIVVLMPGEASFEHVALGARPLGMGSAFTAMADDANTVRWNPAALVHVPSRQVDLSYLDLYNLIGYSAVALVVPRAPAGWGVSVVSSNDVDGSYQELELGIAMAYPLRAGITAGATLRYLGANAQMNEIRIGQGRGVGVDIAFSAESRDGTLKTALTIPNLVSRLSYHRNPLWRGPEARYTESASREYRLGLAWQVKWHPSTHVALEMASGPTWKLGIESDVGGGFRARGGVQLGEGLNQGWALGFGYTTGAFQLDYAYAIGRYGVATSQMSLGVFY